jgi:hypothetical protein
MPEISVTFRMAQVTWTQYSHECNDFDSSECILVNQIGADQTPRPAQSSFTMDSNDLYTIRLGPKSRRGRQTIIINHILRLYNERLDRR